jgi:DNA-binding transcriptional MerR regulator
VSEEAESIGIDRVDLDALPAGDDVIIPDKLYFKIGEVCAITGVKQHVLRYWESEFPSIRPQRARSKQRLYRRIDVENILKIKRLLKEKGFTIHGARKVVADDRKPADIAKEAESTNNERGGLMGEIKEELLALKKLLEK